MGNQTQVFQSAASDRVDASIEVTPEQTRTKNTLERMGGELEQTAGDEGNIISYDDEAVERANSAVEKGKIDSLAVINANEDIASKMPLNSELPPEQQIGQLDEMIQNLSKIISLAVTENNEISYAAFRASLNSSEFTDPNLKSSAENYQLFAGEKRDSPLGKYLFDVEVDGERSILEKLFDDVRYVTLNAKKEGFFEKIAGNIQDWSEEVQQDFEKGGIGEVIRNNRGKIYLAGGIIIGAWVISKIMDDEGSADDQEEGGGGLWKWALGGLGLTVAGGAWASAGETGAGILESIFDKPKKAIKKWFSEQIEGMTDGAVETFKQSIADKIPDWMKTLLGIGDEDAAGQASGGNGAGPSLVEAASETAGQWWTSAKQSYDTVHENLQKFATDHNLSLPDWLPSLSFSNIASELNIDSAKKSAEITLNTTGTLAVTYFLSKYINKKIGIGAGLSTGIFLFFLREGKESLGASGLHSLFAGAENIKNNTFAGLEKYFPHVGAFLKENITFDINSLSGMTDDLLEYAKMHPVKTIAAPWLATGVIFITLKSLKNHPILSGVATTTSATLFVFRKKIVDIILDESFGAETSPEKESARSTYYKWLLLETNEEIWASYTSEEQKLLEKYGGIMGISKEALAEIAHEPVDFFLDDWNGAVSALSEYTTGISEEESPQRSLFYHLRDHADTFEYDMGTTILQALQQIHDHETFAPSAEEDMPSSVEIWGNAFSGAVGEMAATLMTVFDEDDIEAWHKKWEQKPETNENQEEKFLDLMGIAQKKNWVWGAMETGFFVGVNSANAIYLQPRIALWKTLIAHRGIPDSTEEATDAYATVAAPLVLWGSAKGLVLGSVNNPFGPGSYKFNRVGATLIGGVEGAAKPLTFAARQVRDIAKFVLQPAVGKELALKRRDYVMASGKHAAIRPLKHFTGWFRNITGAHRRIIDLERNIYIKRIDLIRDINDLEGRYSFSGKSSTQTRTLITDGISGKEKRKFIGNSIKDGKTAFEYTWAKGRQKYSARFASANISSYADYLEEDISALETRHAQMSAKVEITDKELSEIQQERKDLKRAIKTDIETLKKQQKELQEKIIRLEKDLKSARGRNKDEILSKKTHLKELQQEQLSTQKKLKETKARLKKTKQYEVNLQENIEAKKQAIINYESKIATQQSTVDSLEQKLRNLETEAAEKSTRTFEEQKAFDRQKQSKRQALEKELSQQRQAMKEEMRQLEESLTKQAEKKAAQIEKQAEKMSQTAEQELESAKKIRSEAADKGREAMRAAENQAQIIEENARKNQKISDELLERSKRVVAEAEAEAQTITSDAKAEVEKARNILSELSDDVARAEKRLTVLQGQIDTLNHQVQDSLEEISELEAKKQNVTGSIEERKAALADIDSEIHQSRERLRKNRREIKTLEKQRENLIERNPNVSGGSDSSEYEKRQRGGNRRVTRISPESTKTPQTRDPGVLEVDGSGALDPDVDMVLDEMPVPPELERARTVDVADNLPKAANSTSLTKEYLQALKQTPIKTILNTVPSLFGVGAAGLTLWESYKTENPEIKDILKKKGAIEVSIIGVEVGTWVAAAKIGGWAIRVATPVGLVLLSADVLLQAGFSSAIEAKERLEDILSDLTGENATEQEIMKRLSQMRGISFGDTVRGVWNTVAEWSLDEFDRIKEEKSGMRMLRFEALLLFRFSKKKNLPALQNPFIQQNFVNWQMRYIEQKAPDFIVEDRFMANNLIEESQLFAFQLGQTLKHVIEKAPEKLNEEDIAELEEYFFSSADEIVRTLLDEKEKAEPKISDFSSKLHAGIYNMSKRFNYEGGPDLDSLKKYFSKENSRSYGLFWDENLQHWFPDFDSWSNGLQGKMQPLTEKNISRLQYHKRWAPAAEALMSGAREYELQPQQQRQQDEDKNGVQEEELEQRNKEAHMEIKNRFITGGKFSFGGSH